MGRTARQSAMSVDDARNRALRLIAALSPQEVEIVACLVCGYSIETIAALLSMTPQAATQAKQGVMEKLSAGSTADVVRIGIYARVARRH